MNHKERSSRNLGLRLTLSIELFSAKQVAKNPEYRKFLHGALVFWLDGNEEVGQITNSENASSVRFNIAPMNVEADMQWWTV